MKQNYKIKGKSLKLQDSWSLCEFSHYEESVELIFLCSWELNGEWILGLGGNETGEVYTSGKNNIVKVWLKRYEGEGAVGLTGKENVGFQFEIPR